MAHGGARPGSGPKAFNASSAKLRRQLVAKVMELTEDGRGPIEVAAEIMLDDSHAPNIRLAAASLMLQHAIPKQAQIDVRDDRRDMSLDQVVQRIDQRMAQLQQLKRQAPTLLEGEVKRVD